MKPIIGVTSYIGDNRSYYAINRNYLDSVAAAGGIPVTIPIINNEEDFDYYINILDGLLLTGGIDVFPLSYGENPIHQVNIVGLKRDEYELGLFKRAYDKHIPVLGICRGHQLINVALGGNLYQDIKAQVQDSLGHSPDGLAMDELYHSVNIKENSKLYEILKDGKLIVNSFHHQSIKKLGANLTATAFSTDGIIEGIEGTDREFLLGVQWHPECLTKKYPLFLKLFEGLVSAAKK